MEMEMEIQPLNDRILVERDQAESVTAGGIIIPETGKEPPLIGTVIAVGSGAILQNGSRRPLDIEIGDRVLFNKYAGSEVEIGGRKLLVMTENDVHAKVRSTAKAAE